MTQTGIPHAANAPGRAAAGGIDPALLTARRDRLALDLVATARLVPRFAAEIEAAGDDGRDLAERENISLVDYAVGWLARGDATSRALYIGERAKMAYDPAHDAAARDLAIRALLESDARIFEAALAEAPAPARAAVREGFAQAASLFFGKPARQLDVLLVGDCLHLDVVSFLAEPLARAGVGIAPHFITDKDAAGAAKAIRRLRDRSFHAIFYSPFTYENGLAWPQLLHARRSVLAGRARDEAKAAMFGEMETVARALATTFSGPIFVHNSAVVPRHMGTVKEAAKRLVTAPLRRALRAEIDARVDATLAALNAETFPHLHKLDETRWLERADEGELGAYLHHHGLQHPARLGARLAEDYALALETVAHLLGKKLVACDLDNTLWDGEIGEGAVTQFHDRQAVLRRLREKGVLLATLSKNDPANVRWDGATLGDADFVHHNISWQPKALAFPRMEKDLNLKRKDFVMLDDRADERALVTETYPEVRAFDPVEPRTWAAFALWERLLDPDPDMDRTRMYRDRAEREAALQAQEEAEGADRAAMFATLGLTLKVWEAGKADLKRATELVNRTNQFNTTAARVSYAQMLEWAQSGEHKVLVASMSDKFGDMGVISVLAADAAAEGSQGQVDVPAFVLSCRVFGYGAETALLAETLRWAESRGQGVRARIVPTLVNGPCREVYAEAGFAPAGENAWTWSPGDPIPQAPEWLTVERPG
ncbi:HAD-IIIC family phosphatase [Albimonas sp. CAU 1670]|uniref:HAD-IIIC family phosphatase n=1 Tax=Albimonas sp. CAU 1670 TaxID=3032599 RepID=UPI0023DC5234|nr:HAD-IIIC family phosphatase [Albimonas sp. CAU 1670]MDF2231836.1 HAD-IIIC family phosphatase [Albimonas sp. CAU 1670]